MEGKNLSKTYWLLFDTDCRIQACVMVLNYKIKKGRKEIPIPPLPLIKELT
jgi:hypothetical protein